MNPRGRGSPPPRCVDAAPCAGSLDEVVGRPRPGQRRVDAGATQRPRLFTNGRPERAALPDRHEKRRVEQQPRSRRGALQARAPLRRGGLLLDHLVHAVPGGPRLGEPPAADIEDVALAREELGPGPCRPLRGFLARLLLVPREPQPPLDLLLDALEDAPDARAIRSHVLGHAVVGREQGQELHRQQRGCGEERFDDVFVRDRPRTDPVEILEAPRQRRFAMLRLGHALDDGPHTVANLDRAKLVSAGHPLADAAEGRPPGAADQAEGVAERRAHNQRILVLREEVRDVRGVRAVRVARVLRVRGARAVRTLPFARNLPVGSGRPLSSSVSARVGSMSSTCSVCPCFTPMRPRRGGASSMMVVCGASMGSWKSPETLASIWNRLSPPRSIGSPFPQAIRPEPPSRPSLNSRLRARRSRSISTKSLSEISPISRCISAASNCSRSPLSSFISASAALTTGFSVHAMPPFMNESSRNMG